MNAPFGIVLVHNGNLTNASALKAELFSSDHRHINTESDTEVLVHGYRQWGADLPKKLLGAVTFCALLMLSPVDAAVCYYGGDIPANKDAQPKCPVMFHWGAEDASIPLDKVRALEDETGTPVWQQTLATIDALPLILPCASSSGISSLIPTQTSNRAPTIFRKGTLSSVSAKAISATRRMMAPAVPHSMPCMRCLAGKLRHAKAMTTALSPPSRMSIRMI